MAVRRVLEIHTVLNVSTVFQELLREIDQFNYIIVGTNPPQVLTPSRTSSAYIAAWTDF